MKYIRFILPVIAIFLSIGYAATNVTLSISGDTYIGSDLADFDVYFSSVKLNGVEDLSLVKSSTEFELTITENAEYTIDYEVTNASTKFDALVDVNCEYEFGDITNSVNHNFDSTTSLISRTTRSGKFYTDLIEPVSLSNPATLNCKINASPIEKNELGEGEVNEAVNPWAIGKEITLGTEKFNVISTTDTTVTMLAKYNLGTDYRQSTTANNVKFSATAGWEYTPGPKEIDIQTWATNPKTYVNEYVSYLQGETGDTTLSGNLITLAELGNLGCKVPTDYAYRSGGWTCTGSQYSEWLVNGQNWWTRSAHSDSSSSLWFMNDDDILVDDYYRSDSGVRPVITISKEAILNYVPPTIIEFTIDWDTCYAYDGMTWREWVESDFNDLGYTIVDSTIQDSDGNKLRTSLSQIGVWDPENMQYTAQNVNINDLIESEEDYYILLYDSDGDGVLDEEDADNGNDNIIIY